MGAVIGHEPQDLKFDRSRRTYLRIGDRNVFREYCNIHRGTEPESATVIGNECYIMATAHVGHNCVIGNNVIICNCALVAGHVHVGDRAFISGGVVIHQFTHVGRLGDVFRECAGVDGRAAVHAGGGAQRDPRVEPGRLAAGEDFREALGELKKLYQLFYLSGMNGTQALAEASRDGAFTTCRSAGVYRIRAELAERDLSASGV
jgi:UDP-N-acetylglucosamine acyltransferase